MRAFKRLLADEEGAEVSEWALLVVVLGLAIIAGGPTLSDALKNGLGKMGGVTQTGGTNLNAAIPTS
jgi:Flp pilus assembly pilin Flp